MAAAKTEAGTDVAVPAVPRPDDEVLRNINSLDDAFAAFADMGVDLRDISDEIGTGFTLVDGDDGKRRLVGVPMVFIAWTFNLGDFGPFVSVYAITEDGRKLIINDGSTGIYSQLEEYTEHTGRQNALRLSHGLRVSDYQLMKDGDTLKPAPRDFQGQTVPAATFYLDTSK